MKLLDRLERRLGFLAIPNVILGIVIAQLFIYGAIITGRLEMSSLLLIPKAVFAGEWWRLVSFVITPPYPATTLFQALFLAFFWYIFWIMGQTLEAAWGLVRLNLYLFVCIALAVGGAFVGQLLAPEATLFVAPRFLYFSVFFAFASFNPNMQFLIFFVIPMKVKWIAWILLGVGALVFLTLPSFGHRLAFIAPYLGYLFFFGGELKQGLQAQRRRAGFEKERRAALEEPLHTCHRCGATDRSHPDRDFRYREVDGDAVCTCNACRQA
jgi:hypothetical protein